jgi:ABC-type branched-subunit amino acid transport system ATPase component
VLSIRRLQKKYGGVAALDGCSFDVCANEITAIIGPNGAGKSTLLNCIAGVEQPDAGEIRLLDADVTAAKPYTLARWGLARTFQISRELTSLTLLENVVLASRKQADDSFLAPLFRPGRVRRAENLAISRAMGLLERVGLGRLADETASVLSGGQKKLLELARALMLEPKIVLLDEPAAGVAPPMVTVLVDIIRELNAEGVTFALVEHNMDMVSALSDQVVVMAEGKTLVTGTFEQVTSDPRVVEAYLGGVL